MKMRLRTLRLISLSSVFSLLIILPLLQVYQNYVASHVHHKLDTKQQLFYNTTDSIVTLFTKDPENALDNFKGTTWSATLFDYQISDPLAVVSQTAAKKSVNWTFFLTALIPILITLLMGRIFCSWICPANLLFELNDNVAVWLKNKGIELPINKVFLPNASTKYGILLFGLLLCISSGIGVFTYIYPPAIIGREIYYAIAISGFSVGILFLVFALLFDLFIERRGFCRYLCPGGALYALLGRFRLLKIRRDISQCNNCQMCNGICPYKLTPMSDDFGMECNNCGDCISICHSSALSYQIKFQEMAYQGPGKLNFSKPNG